MVWLENKSCRVDQKPRSVQDIWFIFHPCSLYLFASCLKRQKR